MRGGPPQGDYKGIQGRLSEKNITLVIKRSLNECDLVKDSGLGKFYCFPTFPKSETSNWLWRDLFMYLVKCEVMFKLFELCWAILAQLLSVYGIKQHNRDPTGIKELSETEQVKQQGVGAPFSKLCLRGNPQPQTLKITGFNHLSSRKAKHLLLPASEK